MAKEKKTSGAGKQSGSNGSTRNKRFQRHFRKFHDGKTTGHRQYVYDEEGNEYKILGITESWITNGVRNAVLTVNPEPNNKTQAYMRHDAQKIKKGTMNDRLANWHIAP